MKKFISVFMGSALLCLAGCQRHFSPYLEQGQKAFADKNYINAIDEINIGLSYWRESDGKEKKAQAYQTLGQSYHQLQNTDKAIEAYRQAISLSDQTYDAGYNLGMLCLAQGQNSAALIAFRETLRMKPNDPAALLGLGHSYYAQGQYELALETYQKVIDVSPGVKEALESMGLAKSKLRTHAAPSRKPAAPKHKPQASTKRRTRTRP